MLAVDDGLAANRGHRADPVRGPIHRRLRLESGIWVPPVAQLRGFGHKMVTNK